MALTSVEEAQTRDLIAQQSALLSLASSEATIISKLGATKKNISNVGAAVAFNDTDLLVVRQGTTDLSITGAIIKAATMTTVVDASATALGIVELATSAEVITGTDTTRAVTPAGLQAKVASATALGIVELATSAEAIAGTSDAVVLTPLQLRNGLNASGTAPIYACRAWVNFNGTGTVAIRASGNVSSITDNGVGDYTVNFTTAMQDANYSVAMSTTGLNTTTDQARIMQVLGTEASGAGSKTTSSIRVVRGLSAGAGGLVDAAEINVAIFR